MPATDVAQVGLVGWWRQGELLVGVHEVENADKLDDEEDQQYLDVLPRYRVVVVAHPEKQRVAAADPGLGSDAAAAAPSPVALLTILKGSLYPALWICGTGLLG